MHQVRVLAESHAAFLAARDDLEVPIDDLRGSVLIIDIGSSTTDFTLVENLEQTRRDFGSNELGAGLLDKIIFRRWLNAEDDADIETLFKQYPQHVSQCVLYCRMAKEEYFKSDNTDEVPASLTKRLMIHGQRILFDVEISDNDMKDILSTPIGDVLERKSELHRLDWKSAFMKKLGDARNAIADSSPQMILLTGGASRMDFVPECCEEVFPSATVKRGSEPSFTIARGLAWAGRQLNRTARFRGDLDDIITSGAIQDAVRQELSNLLPRVAEVCADVLREKVVVPCFKDWQDGRIATLNDMSGEMAYRSKHVFSDFSDKGLASDFKAEVNLWLDERVKPSVEKTSPTCM